MHFDQMKNFSIIREHILQVSNDICAFYERAKVHDLDTGEEEYIREDLVDMLFPMFDKYATTYMKREGKCNYEKEDKLLKLLESDKELNDLLGEIDVENAEQVSTARRIVEGRYPNISKLWRL